MKDHRLDGPRILVGASFGMLVLSPVFLLSIALIFAYSSRLAVLSRDQGLASRAKQVLAEGPLTHRKALELRHHLLDENSLYQDQRSEESAARMSQSIKEIFDLPGCDLRSETIEPITREGGLDKITLGIDGLVSSEALPQVLTELYSKRPMLFVSLVTLSAEQRASPNAQLWMNLKVSAFRRPADGAN